MKKSITKQDWVKSISYCLNRRNYKIFYFYIPKGEFRSSSRRAFRIEGSTLDIPFTVDHVIHFEECPFASLDNTTIFKLKVGRNFVTYDARELIVRFAMTTKISPLQGFLFFFNFLLFLFSQLKINVFWGELQRWKILASKAKLLAFPTASASQKKILSDVFATKGISKFIIK